MSAIQRYAGMLTAALFSETIVVSFFNSSTASEDWWFQYTLTVGKHLLATVTYYSPTDTWSVKHDTGNEVCRTVEDAAKFIRTLPGFKLNKHETRLSEAKHATTTKKSMRPRHMGVRPNVGSRWITRDECDTVIIPKLDKWLAVHETKARVNA